MEQLKKDDEILEKFASLDDIDIWSAIKVWSSHPDTVLSLLSKRLLSRKLFKVQLTNRAPAAGWRKEIEKKVTEQFGIPQEQAHYLVISGTISNHAYLSETAIKVCNKDHEVVDVATASDLPNIKALTQEVEKHYVCWPKEVRLE